MSKNTAVCKVVSIDFTEGTIEFNMPEFLKTACIGGAATIDFTGVIPVDCECTGCQKNMYGLPGQTCPCCGGSLEVMEGL